MWIPGMRATFRYPARNGFVQTFLALCLCVASVLPAVGQAGGQATPHIPTRYSFKAWTMEEGLPQNSVNAILQTRDGYLWLATFGGLARFDGVKFTHFRIADHAGLFSDRSLALYEDRQGTLWIGHETEGLSRYRAGRFTSFDQTDGLPAQSIRAIVEGPEGDLWLGTEGGLVRLRDGVFTVYTEADGLPNLDTRSLLVDRQGVLWVGTNGGLVRHGGDSSPAFSPVEGVPQEEIVSLLEDPAGTLWVATESTLIRLSDGRGEVFQEHPNPLKAGQALAVDHEGRIFALAKTGSALHRLSESGPSSSFEVVELPEGTNGSNLSVDREGNLWVGTFGAGLWRLRSQPVQRITDPDNVPSHEVRVIISDGEGGLWIGFGCGIKPSLFRWRDGQFTDYPTGQNGEPFTCITAFAQSRSGAVWLADHGQLIRYAEGAFTRSKMVDDESLHTIYALFEDRDENLWIGSHYGLLRLRGDDLTTFTTRDGLVNDSVHFITQSRDGALWIGTNGGLSRFQGGTFTSFTTDDGLGPGMVRAVYEDREGSLWIGTYGGGLARFKDGEFVRLTAEDGLGDNVISRIFEDQRGNFWMLGNLGLFSVARQDLNALAEGKTERITVISFGKDDGMTEGSGSRQPAGWQTPDGKLWLPTINGLAMIDAHEFRKNEVPPPVVIERVLVNGRETAPDGPIEIAPGHRKLEIQYTGLSLAAPEEVVFEFLLENYDDAWVHAGPRRVAYYTNLPPGHYTFRVRAANNHGIWNETGTALRVIIHPFFYERGEFWGLVSLLVLLLGYLALRLRVRSVELRNRRLQKEIDERRRLEGEREALIRTLEAQNAELERFTYTVSHDLKTPLVTIKGFLGLLEKDAAAGHTDRVQRDINRIGNAADTMSQLLEELLELSRIGRVLNPSEEVSITELAREAAGLVQGALEARGVEPVIQDEMPIVYGDRVRLLEVFQNLLDNAVKFLGDVAKPQVEVGTRTEDGETVYYVRDNGRGVEPKYHEKIFGLFERLQTGIAGTGIGLALVKRILTVHGGRIWVESQGDGNGSTFCFTIGEPITEARTPQHGSSGVNSPP